MKNRLFAYFFPVLAGLPAVGAAMEPAWLEVHLLDRQTGHPVTDAAICLGTSARPDQIGARRSDPEGVVRFDDITPHPLVLTVSGKGYQGQRQELEPIYESRVLVLKLVSGGGGPQCDAPLADAAAGSASGLSIQSVNIGASPAGGSGLLVETRVSGPANQIRISEQPDFGDAAWQPYRAAVSYTPRNGHAGAQLYIQVRRVAQVEGASLEVVSPVKQVRYRRK